MKSTHSQQESATEGMAIKLMSSSIAAGFPSPADDFIDRALDLNELVVAHPNSTFFMRASGSNLRAEGILKGDLLVVDRAAGIRVGGIVVAIVNGELCLRVLRRDLRDEGECEIWGVVTHVIRAL